MKLTKNGPLYVYLCAFKFQLINIVDDVMAAIFVGKTRPLSWPQFSSDFLVIWYVSSIFRN